MHHPLLGTFIRLTLIIALAIVGIFILAVVLKVVLFAAILAGVGVGGLFLYNLIRRRSSAPVIRQ